LGGGVGRSVGVASGAWVGMLSDGLGEKWGLGIGLGVGWGTVESHARAMIDSSTTDARVPRDIRANESTRKAMSSSLRRGGCNPVAARGGDRGAV
jgi:hypothetical protein